MSNHCHGECDKYDHNHVTDADKASAYSLYRKIDTYKLPCLNETLEGSEKYVFKPWNQHMDKEKFVGSDSDEELLFNIPFTRSVKLKGIIIIGGEENTHPRKMRVRLSIGKFPDNMDDYGGFTINYQQHSYGLKTGQTYITFDDADTTPDQEFDLQPDYTGSMEYDTKAARFNQCDCISLHFPSNFGADTTKIYYIGLKGDLYRGSQT